MYVNTDTIIIRKGIVFNKIHTGSKDRIKIKPELTAFVTGMVYNIVETI